MADRSRGIGIFGRYLCTLAEIRSNHSLIIPHDRVRIRPRVYVLIDEIRKFQKGWQSLKGRYAACPN